MCTFRMLDVVKERPQSGNGHANGLSPRNTDKRQVKGKVCSKSRNRIRPIAYQSKIRAVTPVTAGGMKLPGTV